MATTREVMAKMPGLEIEVWNVDLTTGYAEVRTHFSKVFGAMATPLVGINAPAESVKVDWTVDRAGAKWVTLACEQANCSVSLVVFGRD